MSGVRGSSAAAGEPAGGGENDGGGRGVGLLGSGSVKTIVAREGRSNGSLRVEVVELGLCVWVQLSVTVENSRVGECAVAASTASGYWLFVLNRPRRL